MLLGQSTINKSQFSSTQESFTVPSIKHSKRQTNLDANQSLFPQFLQEFTDSPKLSALKFSFVQLKILYWQGKKISKME
jgi:hypothetical protein